MIHHYGVTLQGTYHIKNNIVCQDAHNYIKINDSFAIGAVADGLGSEQYSDVASKIAVEKSIEYCKDKISENDSTEDILKVIKESFRVSLDAINALVKELQHDLNEYDTTLALVVFIKGNMYFGNSGDSGIVVLNQDGTYESVTTQQRDDNGCVFPLFFGENKWEFGFKKNVGSVLLATDGMFETLFPYLLKGEKIEIYVALARYMMSEESLDFKNNTEKIVNERMTEFIKNIPDEQVSDDKTVLVMLNTDMDIEKQPEEYYKTPDWTLLKQKRDEEYKKAAYPHLFS